MSRERLRRRAATESGKPKTVANERTLLIMGLVAVVIGSIQVGATLALIGSSTHKLTGIDTLRLYFCGSLATVGVLVLVNVSQHRRRSKRPGALQ